MMQPAESRNHVDAGLLLFEPTSVNAGVESSYYIDYLPTNQIIDDGPVEFTVPPNGAL